MARAGVAENGTSVRQRARQWSDSVPESPSVDATPKLNDRLWAVGSVIAGLLALNGALLALTALLDGSPIPFTVGVSTVVLGAFGCRAAWRRTLWAARTRATGIPFREQQRNRDLRPREVVLTRVTVIGAPVVLVALGGAGTLPWAYVAQYAVFAALMVAIMPTRQRRQLLGRA